MNITLDAIEAPWLDLDLDAQNAIRDWLDEHGIDPGTARRVTLLSEGLLEVEEYVRDPDTGQILLHPRYRDTAWTQVYTVPVAYLPEEWPL